MKHRSIPCALFGIALLALGGWSSGGNGGDAVKVRVTGKQWMWHFTQPNGTRENNELHVPVGKPVTLVMTSTDVGHKLLVPGLKLDEQVVRGRETTRTFTATRVGKYTLSCGADCGAHRAKMSGTVHVVSATNYAKWLASGRPPMAKR